LPSDLTEWLEAAQKVVTIVAALTAAAVAVLGLRAWHVQLRGRTEYDLARRVLRAVFEVRDQLSAVRRSYVPAAEIVDAFQDSGLDPATIDFANDPRRDSLVYQRRWKPLAKALSDLAVEAVEAEVLWGKPVRDLQMELQGLAGKLNGALTVYLRDINRQHRDPEKAGERLERMAAIVYADYGESGDLFQQEVEGVTRRFQELLGPRLRFRG
jgi:hypothetical protein